jgi:uncharacterized membrane protein YqjE
MSQEHKPNDRPEPEPVTAGVDRPASSLTVAQLVGEIKDQLTLLVRKQIDLARTELKEDIKAEAVTVGGLGLAAVGAIIAVTLLLVTVILALATVMPAWGAGLIVSGVVLLASALAALIGWSKRVRKPLEKTRQSLKEDIQWTKERLA